MASSSRSNKKKEHELNDGATRIGWHCPKWDEDWLLYGRTHADKPITEEEEAEWDDAWAMYYSRYDGDLDIPPTYMDVNRITLLEQEPPASQVMPQKLREEIQKANDLIDGYGDEWNRSRKIQLQREEEIKNRKETLKVMAKDLKSLEKELEEVNKFEDHLQQEINEHYYFIKRCEDVYPH